MKEFVMISSDDLEKLAEIILEKVNRNTDEYLTPSQLSERIPAMSKTQIQLQIRQRKYGKKIGEKGRLVAKISEVKKHNRL